MAETVTFFDDPGEFLDQVTVMYEADEGRHTLLLGVAMRVRAGLADLPEKPLLAVVRDEQGRLLGSALRTPPHYLLVQSDPADAAALEELVRELSTRGETIPGVNGAAEASDLFARLWSEKTGRNAILERAMRSYLLREVVHLPKPEGAMRPAAGEDAPVTLAMINAMLAETGSGNDQPWTEEKMSRTVAAGSVFVWDVSGVAVSMAMLTRPTRQAKSVSGVYTSPELRRRGYATALVAELSQWILDQGYTRAGLFTDLANPISNSIYQKIGYEPVCDYHQYRFA